MKDLSIVIITYNSRKLLEPCIESVRHNTRSLDYEIIVVENGSEDGSAEWLRTQTDIKSVFNDRNRGVAPARNQGLSIAEGRYLMILDVDTMVEQDAFATLVACMDAHPETGLAAPKLTDGGGEVQLSCRYYPTAVTKLYRRIPLGFAKKRLVRETLADWSHDSERAVDYVIGACQIFRREAFEQVGLLDENIFYGPEDIDYCLRMWAAGWTVMYFPQAVVKHLERRITTKLLSKMTLRHAWGLAHFFWKYKYLLNTRKLNGCENRKKG
ncbi:MAG TPA: glycosyltransferase family 2 protein [bacterium]|nr:glycosyltransferase family 2 protein [bacterium]